MTLPPAILQPAGHCLMLELVTQELARAVTQVRAACDRLQSPNRHGGKMVWCSDYSLPFDSSHAAASFVVEHGGGDGYDRLTVAMKIRRAARRGAVAYGVRWKQRLEQPDEPKYLLRKRSRSVVVDGVAYPSLMNAADGSYRQWMRIHRAMSRSKFPAHVTRGSR